MPFHFFYHCCWRPAVRSGLSKDAIDTVLPYVLSNVGIDWHESSREYDHGLNKVPYASIRKRHEVEGRGGGRTCSEHVIKEEEVAPLRGNAAAA